MYVIIVIGEYEDKDIEKILCINVTLPKLSTLNLISRLAHIEATFVQFYITFLLTFRFKLIKPCLTFSFLKPENLDNKNNFLRISDDKNNFCFIIYVKLFTNVAY